MSQVGRSCLNRREPCTSRRKATHLFVVETEMTEARRRLLNRRVAEALESVHATALDAVAAQIAGPYSNAGLIDRAAVYYQRGAGVAQRIGANAEAIGLLDRGLTLLGSLPPSPDGDGRELGLQTALAVSLVATEGYGSAVVRSPYERSGHLCQVLGRPPSPPILRALAISRTPAAPSRRARLRSSSRAFHEAAPLAADKLDQVVSPEVSHPAAPSIGTRISIASASASPVGRASNPLPCRTDVFR